MADNFVSIYSQDQLVKSLQCWKNILPFLRTMYIINKNYRKANRIVGGNDSTECR